MQRVMCKSKIHRATVTGADLNYEGSITIDALLMEAADIREYEQVQVVNLNNGARFETYAIRGEPGWRTPATGSSSSATPATKSPSSRTSSRAWFSWTPRIGRSSIGRP